MFASSRVIDTAPRAIQNAALPIEDANGAALASPCGGTQCPSVVAAPADSPPKRAHYPECYALLEDSRMEREMHRL